MGILTPLYNLPNRVVEKQKLYQSDSRPIMLRTPRARLYLGAYGALWVVGMCGTVYGCVSLIKGKKQE